MPQARSGRSGSSSSGGSGRRSTRSSRSKSTGGSSSSRAKGAARKTATSRAKPAARSTAGSRSKTSSRAKSATKSTGRSTSRGKSTAGARGTRSTASSDAIAQRLRKLNERIIEAGREAGETTLTSYERALKTIASTIERGPGSSDIEWVANLATAQAKFIREMLTPLTERARKALK